MGTNKINSSFVFYEEWWEILEDERQEVQWEVIRAVMEYVFRGNLVELKPNSSMAFKFIKKDIDRAKENYHQFISKQTENGKKGGRPKRKTETQENPKNPLVFSKTQENPKKPNDNDNDKEKDKGRIIIPEMLSVWCEVIPDYVSSFANDFPELKKILDFMIEQRDVGVDIGLDENIDKAMQKMRVIANNVKQDKFYCNKPLSTISKQIQQFYGKKQTGAKIKTEIEKILEYEKKRSEKRAV